ncbi:MAG TPA: 5'/3'-nucleotidase SurE [Anaerolineales bacterium]|nr:5'/3'-nucleotidase SurE [Anaerolineales bacterium]
MIPDDRPLILLTNDDGIRSPGLWAAAESLSEIGFVFVVAPREQQSGSGRSMPPSSDGAIHEQDVVVGGKSWKVYAVGGSPAQAVQHALFELVPRKPDLVVSGINYGENVSTSVTISGTIGAALEGAAAGIPALAVSQEAESRYHLTHSEEVDFSAAAFFARQFGATLMKTGRLQDVDVLKVDVPIGATPETPWRLTRLSRMRYYEPVASGRTELSEPGLMGYRVSVEASSLEPGSDAHALRVERKVSVTPLSLDMTSRVPFAELESALKSRRS